MRERCEAAPEALGHGEDYILYAILDFIVDNYAPVLEAITDEVECIEDRVLVNSLCPEDINRLYLLSAICCGCAMPRVLWWMFAAGFNTRTAWRSTR